MAKRHPRPRLRCPHQAAPAVIDCPTPQRTDGSPIPLESANAPVGSLRTVLTEGRPAGCCGADETRQR